MHYLRSGFGSALKARGWVTTVEGTSNLQMSLVIRERPIQISKGCVVLTFLSYTIVHKAGYLYYSGSFTLTADGPGIEIFNLLAEFFELIENM